MVASVMTCNKIYIIWNVNWFFDKNVDQIKYARRVSGITFIRYAQNRLFEKPDNLKFWEPQSKDPNHDSPNRQRPPMAEEVDP